MSVCLVGKEKFAAGGSKGGSVCATAISTAQTHAMAATSLGYRITVNYLQGINGGATAWPPVQRKRHRHPKVNCTRGVGDRAPQRSYPRRPGCAPVSAGAVDGERVESSWQRRERWRVEIVPRSRWWAH